MSINKQLIDAIEKKDIMKVKSLIEDGANVNSYILKPLKEASKIGDLEIVKLLIEKGATIFPEQNEALNEAVLCNHKDIIEFFLDKKVDLYTNNEHVMLLAAESGNVEAIKIFIENDINIDNEINKDRYQNVFNFAVIHDSLKVVEVFMQKGILLNFNVEDTLLLAQKHNAINIVKYLIIDCNQDPSIIINNEKSNEEIKNWCITYQNNKELNTILKEELITKPDKNKLKI